MSPAISRLTKCSSLALSCRTWSRSGPRTAVASAAQAVALYYGASPLAGEGPFLAAYVADLTGAPEHAEPTPS